MATRKRRTRAEMQIAKETQKTNGKLKEKVETGQLSDKQLLLSSLPVQKEREYVYVDKEVPVVKEVRILKDNQGTELSITDIVKQELDLVHCWEYMNIPLNEFSIKDLPKLGKDGWKFAFDLTPDVTTSVKVATLIFQRPKVS